MCSAGFVSTQSASTSPALPPENQMLGLAIRLLAVFFIAIMAACVKLASDEGVHLVESLFWRQLAALPVVVLWLYSQGALSDIHPHRRWRHATRMVLGLSGMALNFTAMTMLPLAESTTIGFAVPIFSTVLAAIFLREPTGVWRWSAVMVGFLGVLIVVRPGGAVHGVGSVIALAGAFMTAAVTIQLRTLSRTETTGAIVFWFSLSSLLPLGLLMPFFASGHGPLGWVYIALLSLAGAGAQICLTASLRFAPVSVVMPMDYSALIWGSFYGWLLFNQMPASTTWIGAPIVIAAGVVIAWREHRLKIKERATVGANAALTPDASAAKMEQA
jgi:drug/metabolite transporter (DMT)-like permease